VKWTWRAAIAALLAGCSSPPPPNQPPTPPLQRHPLNAVVQYLTSEVDSAFPGAVLAVGIAGQRPMIVAVGHYGVDDARPVDTATVFDIASLTKVVGLTTMCMLLVHEGKLDLDALVQRYVPAFRGPGKERVTIRHLLTHSSGLPAWRPLYTEATTRATAVALADTTPLTSEPGATSVYSDIGIIVLTQVVEAITGQRLDALLEARLFGPLGMRDTRFLPPAEWKSRIAPTERSQDGTVIHGTVHDENAWRLGGVAGHAGLFSTAPDLVRFVTWLLGGWHGRESEDTAGLTPGRRPGVSRPTLPSELVKEWTRRQNLPPGSSRALGWNTPSGPNSSAGTKLGPLAFGHTGFTGTSIWIDPERALFIILLTNRVHPTRENNRIGRVRSRVADLVVTALTEN
jgi:CubicO group peptidase (beta-lactamase class C family)